MSSCIPAPAAALVLTTLVLQTSSTGPWPRSIYLPAQICIERPGDNGALNVRQASILIAGGPGLTLLGEQAACGFVAAGRHRLWVQSRDPYDPTSTDPEAWKSDPLTIAVGANERVELEVCGLARNGAYATWVIRRSTGTCR